MYVGTPHGDSWPPIGRIRPWPTIRPIYRSFFSNQPYDQPNFLATYFLYDQQYEPLVATFQRHDQLTAANVMIYFLYDQSYDQLIKHTTNHTSISLCSDQYTTNHLINVRLRSRKYTTNHMNNLYNICPIIRPICFFWLNQDQHHDQHTTTSNELHTQLYDQ